MKRKMLLGSVNTTVFRKAGMAKDCACHSQGQKGVEESVTELLMAHGHLVRCKAMAFNSLASSSHGSRAVQAGHGFIRITSGFSVVTGSRSSRRRRRLKPFLLLGRHDLSLHQHLTCSLTPDLLFFWSRPPHIPPFLFSLPTPNFFFLLISYNG